MIQRGLIPYIQTYIRQGYGKELIIQYLRAYGYSVQDISDTYDLLTSKKSHVSYVIAASIIVLLAVGGYFSYTYFFEQPTESFYFVVSVNKPVTPSPEELQYSISLVGTTKSRTLINERLSTLQGDEVYTYQEYVSTLNIPQRIISLSSPLPAGQYSLHITAKNGDVSYEKEYPIQISEVSPTPTFAPTSHCVNSRQDADETGVDCGGSCNSCATPTPEAISCVASCDDDNSCTLDTCSLGQCMHEHILPCCGNEVCEPNENEDSCSVDCASEDRLPSDLTPLQVIERSALLAQSDLEQAGNLCRTLSSEDQSACFDRLAHAAQRSSLCEQVEGSLQSSCYMDFAMQGDYTVCEKIQNKWLKDSCENLKQLSDIQPLPEA